VDPGISCDAASTFLVSSHGTAPVERPQEAGALVSCLPSHQAASSRVPLSMEEQLGHYRQGRRPTMNEPSRRAQPYAGDQAFHLGTSRDACIIRRKPAASGPVARSRHFFSQREVNPMLVSARSIIPEGSPVKVTRRCRYQFGTMKPTASTMKPLHQMPQRPGCRLSCIYGLVVRERSASPRSGPVCEARTAMAYPIRFLCAGCSNVQAGSRTTT
jgi:hypothetical protein